MQRDRSVVVVDLDTYREIRRPAEAVEVAGRLEHARLLGEAREAVRLAFLE